MAIRRGITEFRSVEIRFNDAVGQDIADQTDQVGSGIDAYKAAIGKVEEIEGIYNVNGSFDDVTDKETLITGTTPHKIYLFELTTDVANGVYNFIFVEERPNALDE